MPIVFPEWVKPPSRCTQRTHSYVIPAGYKWTRHGAVKLFVTSGLTSV